MISAVGDDDIDFDDDDEPFRRYANLCDVAEDAGVELRDWIYTNGEMFHSLRMTMSPHLTDRPSLGPGTGWP